MTFDNDPLVYRKLFDRSEFAIVVHGQAGQVVEANQAFADLLGYELSEVRGLSAADVIYPDDLPLRNAEADELFAGHTKSGAVVHRRLVRKDSSLIRVRVRKVVTDYNGEPVVMVVIEDWNTIADLEHDANHDFLTGVRNRRGLYGRLALSYMSVNLLLAMVDVNDLKTVNDTYGHVAGDALLIATASRLVEAAGTGAIVARWAGDEFVVCVPTDSADGHADPAALPEALRAGVALPIDLPGVSVSITPQVSVGITLFNPNVETLDAAVERADSAMYREKRR